MFEEKITKTCGSCGEKMERAVKSYPMGSVFQTERFHVDIYRCPKCQKVELFAAEGEMVTCPICGTPHPAKEKCITCALNAAFDGRK